jgi:hypothetical protein
MSNTPNNQDSQTAEPEWREVKVLVDPDGVIAVITEQVRTGRVSFALYREFEHRGVTKRTMYLQERHLPAVTRLLNDIGEHLALEEDRARARIRDRRTA